MDESAVVKMYESVYEGGTNETMMTYEKMERFSGRLGNKAWLVVFNA